MQTPSVPRIFVPFLSILLAAALLFGAYAQESAVFSAEEKEYLSSLTFFGESTTAHLRARGVLSDGVETTQVWQDESGTKRLGARLLQDPLIDPKTGERMSLFALCEKERPRILVLSFGLNGITEFVKNKELYAQSYLNLIDHVRSASPQTRILLQSVYPVTATCSAWSVDGRTISDYTRILNSWLPEIAQMREDVRYIDTASVLTEAEGCLLPSYDFSGDGIHLTADAYRKILLVLCKEAWV